MIPHKQKFMDLRKIFFRNINNNSNNSYSTDLRRYNYYEKKMSMTSLSKEVIDSMKSISNSLYIFNKKYDKNISLYNKYKSNYNEFSKIYNYMKKRENKYEDEQSLLNNLVNNYKLKKNVDIDLSKIKKSNIFKSSSLIESNVNRLKTYYILNYDDLLKKTKENINNSININDNNNNTIKELKNKTDNKNRKSKNNEIVSIKNENNDNKNKNRKSKNNEIINIKNENNKNRKSKNNEIINIKNENNDNSNFNNNNIDLNNNDKKKNESQNNYIDNNIQNNITENNEVIKNNKSEIMDLEIINNLKEIKFLKKIDLLAQIKKQQKKNVYNFEKREQLIEDNSLFYNEIEEKMKELEKEGEITERKKLKMDINKNINDIIILNKNINILEEKQKKINLNKKNNKINNKIGNNSFYIPTLVKSFPELLYDKIKKKQNTKQNTKIIKFRNNQSFPLINKKNKKDNKFNKRNNMYKQIFGDEINFNRTMNNIKYDDKLYYKIKKIIDNYNYNIKYNIKPIHKKNEIKNDLFLKENNKHASFTYRNYNDSKKNTLKNECLDLTSRIYNKILTLSPEEQRANKNNNSMRNFLKDKNNNYLESVNEKNSKNYYELLKDMNIKNRDLKVDNMEKIYNRNGLLMNNDLKKNLKEITKLNQNMKNNEKNLIKALLSGK